MPFSEVAPDLVLDRGLMARAQLPLSQRSKGYDPVTRYDVAYSYMAGPHRHFDETDAEISDAPD